MNQNPFFAAGVLSGQAWNGLGQYPSVSLNGWPTAQAGAAGGLGGGTGFGLNLSAYLDATSDILRSDSSNSRFDGGFCEECRARRALTEPISLASSPASNADEGATEGGVRLGPPEYRPPDPLISPYPPPAQRTRTAPSSPAPVDDRAAGGEEEREQTLSPAPASPSPPPPPAPRVRARVAASAVGGQSARPPSPLSAPARANEARGVGPRVPETLSPAQVERIHARNRDEVSAQRAPIWASFIANFKACAPNCEPVRYASWGQRGHASCHPSGQALDVFGMSCRYQDTNGRVVEQSHWAKNYDPKFERMVSCMRPKMRGVLFRNGAGLTSGHNDHAHFSNGCYVYGRMVY